MMDLELLESQLAELPLYTYHFITPDQLEFSDRIRWICENECPRFGQTWACPPGVGSVTECACKCQSYQKCLVISTITEVADITDIDTCLATRGPHEEITNEVRSLMRAQGIDPYILSTEACALCDRCAYLDGEPCRFPEKMHPCVESHGINVLALLEEWGLAFQYGENVVTWFSLLFYND